MIKLCVPLVSAVFSTSLVLFGCVTDEGRDVGESVAKERPNTTETKLSINSPSNSTISGSSANIETSAATLPAGRGTSVVRGLKVKLKESEAPGAPALEQVNLYDASHALVIGNNVYRAGWPQLSNAVTDARLVAQTLEKHGFSVSLKTDVGAAELEQSLKEFFVIQGENPEARLFVWYAGHGYSDNGEGFLIPSDAPLPVAGGRFRLKALPMRRFGEYVRLSRSKHTLAVFDSCFAATVFDTQRSLPPVAITRATTLPVRQFITSGDAGQKVSDDGLFRKLFVRAITGEERADANSDGYLTGSEIGLFLTDRITNLTVGRQTPRYGKLRDAEFDRGDFVFANLASGKYVRSTSSAISNVPDADTVFWLSIKESKNPADLQAYLAQFPYGKFVSLARNRLRTGSHQQETAFSVSGLDGKWKVRFNFESSSECYSEKYHELNIRNGKIKGRAFYSNDSIYITGTVDSSGKTSGSGQGRYSFAEFSGETNHEKGSGTVKVSGEIFCSGTWESVRAEAN